MKEKADASYAQIPESKQSISGYAVLLEEAPVSAKSGQQNFVTLSSTESELVSGTHCAQEMLFVKNVLESVGLQVELPIILEIDNKGAVDLANNWSIGSRTCHIDVRYHFLRELKEAGIIKTVWKSGLDMPADLFTKNLPKPLFEKHAAVFVGKDKYMKD